MQNLLRYRPNAAKNYKKNLTISIQLRVEYVGDPFQDTLKLACWLAVWLSGNALASINIVALRQTRLIPGWVTVCGRVNHLIM